MKKSYLLLLAILPLIGSCNKDSGFPNPFPDDKYNKIGFKIDETNEKITRPLTNTETNLVLDTISKKDACDNKIYTMTSDKETRDYTRAFAGEFKQGYNVKNVMKKETIKITRQDSGDDWTTLTNRQRLLKSNESTTVSQYSYGQIKEKVSQDDYVYYAVNDYKEASKADDVKSINLRTKKVENEEYTTYSDKKIIDREEELSKYLSYFYITQSQYITAPDLKSGADKDGKIILVNATQNLHIDEETGKKGVFSLKDGRSYQAIDNSLIVTKLDVDKTDKDWCIASYVRIYKETVITSEVIQPNVQVTKLKTPITISYSEEISHFSREKSSIGGTLPGEQS